MTRVVLPNLLAEVSEAQLPTPATLTQAQRACAATRHELIKPVLDGMASGLSLRAAAEWAFASSRLDPRHSALAGKVKRLSSATLERWARDFVKGGADALAPMHKGRVRGDYGWEIRAAALFRTPGKPAFSTVAYWLRQEGFDSAVNSRVRRYLQGLPSHEAETAPARVGRHFYNQNIRPHKVRDARVLPVGLIYTADGHCFKAIVGHPDTGNPWRPEITVWLDVRSQRAVSWWVSEAESAETTLFSLSQALIAHDHTPAFIHVDPGSGFKALLITDQVSGFLKRFHIEPIFSLPGNARGKGLMEGFWRWMKERCARRFATYCGDDRTDDSLSRLQAKIRRGEITLPTYQQFLDELRRYIAWYNAEPKDALDGKSPDEMWAELERVALEIPAHAVIRPRVVRTVRRWAVIHQKRLYRAADLQGFEAHDVIAEYSLHDDGRVWIHDLKGRFVCEAPLVEKLPWLPASRIEEGKQRRLAGQQQRLQLRMDEAAARARGAIASITPAAIADPLPAAPSLERLRTEQLVDEAAGQDEETPEMRFARARALETAAEIPAADARWLVLYQASAEYHSRRGLMEAFPDEQNKGPVGGRPFNA